ncbi:MAG: VCBS repeat-containing protein [Deltaproteobacteria bacterium]|nr:VCBS repeat-containing protein [Deltaproteobacteria bacterium]
MASVFSGVGTSSVPAEQVIVHGVAAGEPLFERVPQPMPPVGDWGSGRATSVGDVDGDGHIDVLVSLRQSNPVYLYRYATGFSQPSASLMDPVGGSNFGHYFSFGDVSGDGLSDAIISSELAFAMSQGGLPISQGIVYVFVGSMSGTVAEPVRLERSRPHLEEVPREIFGGQPRSPGDLDGDGIDDITMGDSISDRLCVRFGRVGFGAGSPDICQDGVLTWGAQSY